MPLRFVKNSLTAAKHRFSHVVAFIARRDPHKSQGVLFKLCNQRGQVSSVAEEHEADVGVLLAAQLSALVLTLGQLHEIEGLRLLWFFVGVLSEEFLDLVDLKFALVLFTNLLVGIR